MSETQTPGASNPGTAPPTSPPPPAYATAADVAALAARVSALDSEIAALKTASAAVTTALNGLSGGMSQMRDHITSLASAAPAPSSDISTRMHAEKFPNG